jgi:hypothetical protein
MLLAWEESPAQDFDYFTVYGSAVDTLDETAEVLGHTTDTGMDVTGAAQAYFHVTATDANGNEGEEASIAASGTSVPGSAVPTTYAFRRKGPNPVRGATTMCFELPVSGQTRLELFDVRGRTLTTLVNEERQVGTYEVNWNCTDARGTKVGPGIYFVRFESGSFRTTSKIIVTD